MKNNILTNTVFGAGLGLTLLAGAAFANDLPTAEEAISKVCADASAPLRGAVQYGEGLAKKLEVEKGSEGRKIFLQQASDAFAKTFSDVRAIRSAVLAATNDVISKFKEEQAKVISAQGVDKDIKGRAINNLAESYKPAIVAAAWHSLSPAGFEVEAGSDSCPSGAEMCVTKLTKDGREIGNLSLHVKGSELSVSLLYVTTFFPGEKFTRSTAGALEFNADIMSGEAYGVMADYTADGWVTSDERRPFRIGQTEQLEFNILDDNAPSTLLKKLEEAPAKNLSIEMTQKRQELKNLDLRCGAQGPR